MPSEGEVVKGYVTATTQGLPRPPRPTRHGTRGSRSVSLLETNHLEATAFVTRGAHARKGAIRSFVRARVRSFRGTPQNHSHSVYPPHEVNERTRSHHQLFCGGCAGTVGRLHECPLPRTSLRAGWWRVSSEESLTAAMGLAR